MVLYSLVSFNHFLCVENWRHFGEVVGGERHCGEGGGRRGIRGRKGDKGMYRRKWRERRVGQRRKKTEEEVERGKRERGRGERRTGRGRKKEKEPSLSVSFIYFVLSSSTLCISTFSHQAKRKLLNNFHSFTSFPLTSYIPTLSNSFSISPTYGNEEV